ncbi:MAG: hypothetical protein QW423_02790 [Candidatus Aenigmatarchaeota archaeon]
MKREFYCICENHPEILFDYSQILLEEYHNIKQSLDKEKQLLGEALKILDNLLFSPTELLLEHRNSLQIAEDIINETSRVLSDLLYPSTELLLEHRNSLQIAEDIINEELKILNGLKNPCIYIEGEKGSRKIGEYLENKGWRIIYLDDGFSKLDEIKKASPFKIAKNLKYFNEGREDYWVERIKENLPKPHETPIAIVGKNHIINFEEKLKELGYFPKIYNIK